jgi:XTP/dITP diphosphohydrolase
MATTLLIATTNAGKLREIRALLAGLPFAILSLNDVDAPQAPEETGDTFAENARLKALAYAKATGLLTVADDSGLEVDALDRRPGVHSARYPGADYPERFRNLWREMGDSGRPERSARFVCALALASADGILFEARGTVEGEILHEARGSGGFGYDPIFFYPPLGRTLAEVDDQKSAVSHRGEAVRKLRDFLTSTLPLSSFPLSTS